MLSRLQSALLITVLNFAVIGARKASVDICNYDVTQTPIWFATCKIEMLILFAKRALFPLLILLFSALIKHFYVLIEKYNMSM